jgi:hypothetical protein
MNILSKIKYIIIFTSFSTLITLSGFSVEVDTTSQGAHTTLQGDHIMPMEEVYKFPKKTERKQFEQDNSEMFKSDILPLHTNSDGETDKDVSPTSIEYSQSMPLLPIIDQFMILNKSPDLDSYEDNGVTTKAISADDEYEKMDEENLQTPSLLTLYFHSSHTYEKYRLDDFIDKSIGEYIKLLIKKRLLTQEDRALYNYEFQIVCTPELPKNILTDLGISSLTRKTIITKNIAEQLDLHFCTLSFCFGEQTTLSSKYEQSKNKNSNLIDPAFSYSIHPYLHPITKKQWKGIRYNNLLKEKAEEEYWDQYD